MPPRTTTTPLQRSTRRPRAPAPTPAERRALAALEQERKEEAEARVTLWVFLWTLFVFKIATVALVIYIASASGESLGLALSTTWYWLVIPILAITGPVLYRWRLMAQRRRREALRNAEWMVDADDRASSGGDEGPANDIPADSIHVIIHRLDGDRPHQA